MTLGKGHLMATVPLFAAAVVYNIWHFSSGGELVVASPAEPEPASMAASGPSVTGEPRVSLDPSTIPAPPDVALDRLPHWPRDPFTSTRRAPVGRAVVDTTPPAPAPEQDPVVSAIFVSGNRRRARVNGETVTVGDRVGASAIVEIQPNAIVVESPASGRRVITPQRRGREEP